MHAKQGAPDTRVWAIGAWGEGLGIRAVARVFAAAPNPVLRWRVEAAEPLEGFSHDGLRAVHGEPGPLDALCALLRAVTDGAVTEDDALTRWPRSPHWGGWPWSRSPRAS